MVEFQQLFDALVKQKEGLCEIAEKIVTEEVSQHISALKERYPKHQFEFWDTQHAFFLKVKPALLGRDEFDADDVDDHRLQDEEPFLHEKLKAMIDVTFKLDELFDRASIGVVK